jgi:hypothetical protein
LELNVYENNFLNKKQLIKWSFFSSLEKMVKHYLGVGVDIHCHIFILANYQYIKNKQQLEKIMTKYIWAHKIKLKYNQ